MSAAEDLLRFKALIEHLSRKQGGAVPLAQLDRRALPRAGVYFFFDPLPTAGGASRRLVRVGTHGLTEGSGSTIGQRLSQHLGSRDGGGNHRGSIFRLLVGEALIRRGDVPAVPSWGVGADMGGAATRLDRDRETLKQDERPIEQAASAIIGAMPVLVLAVEDAPGPDSLRGLIERNAIGLLSGADARALHPPPDDWLGYHSSRDSVRRSGLWNNRHVGDGHAPEFLDVLEKLIG